MRKWFNQVNRGVLLFIAALLCVAIYLAVDGYRISREKKVLRDLTSQYISDSSILYVFPEGLDFSDRESIRKDTLLPVLYKNAEPIYHYFCDNEAVRKAQVDSTYNYMYGTFVSESKPIACSRSATSIEVIEVYRNSATVIASTQTVFEKEDETGKIVSNEIYLTETLFFLYQDGQWKLVSTESPLNQYEVVFY